MCVECIGNECREMQEECSAPVRLRVLVWCNLEVVRVVVDRGKSATALEIFQAMQRNRRRMRRRT